MTIFCTARQRRELARWLQLSALLLSASMFAGLVVGVITGVLP